METIVSIKFTGNNKEFTVCSVISPFVKSKKFPMDCIGFNKPCQGSIKHSKDARTIEKDDIFLIMCPNCFNDYFVNDYQNMFEKKYIKTQFDVIEDDEMDLIVREEITIEMFQLFDQSSRSVHDMIHLNLWKIVETYILPEWIQCRPYFKERTFWFIIKIITKFLVTTRYKQFFDSFYDSNLLLSFIQYNKICKNQQIKYCIKLVILLKELQSVGYYRWI